MPCQIVAKANAKENGSSSNANQYKILQEVLANTK